MSAIQAVSVVQGSGPMAKAMSISGMVVAGLIALIFTADLAVGIPFGRVATVTDVGFLVSGLILGYLSWNALRESK